VIWSRAAVCKLGTLPNVTPLSLDSLTPETGNGHESREKATRWTKRVRAHADPAQQHGNCVGGGLMSDLAPSFIVELLQRKLLSAEYGSGIT
jgi:hypothetical protein